MWSDFVVNIIMIMFEFCSQCLILMLLICFFLSHIIWTLNILGTYRLRLCIVCIMYKTHPFLKLTDCDWGDFVLVIVWWLDLQLHVQSVPITTKVMSSIPTHGEVYSIQHYVIKYVSDLQQVRGFLRVLQFPPPIKLTATI